MYIHSHIAIIVRMYVHLQKRVISVISKQLADLVQSSKKDSHMDGRNQHRAYHNNLGHYNYTMERLQMIVAVTNVHPSFCCCCCCSVDTCPCFPRRF